MVAGDAPARSRISTILTLSSFISCSIHRPFYNETVNRKSLSYMPITIYTTGELLYLFIVLEMTSTDYIIE